MRSFRSVHNLLAVSANNRETAINTVQTLDTSMLVSMSDILDREPRREDNANELTGFEEPDTIYDLGGKAKGPLTFEKAQAQHFAFILAYALGSVSTAAAGTGYEHTITPIADDLDIDRSVPTFTAGQRYGKTVLKRQFASMAIDSFAATFAKDQWVKLVAQAVGTGLMNDNIYEETISELDNATSLTLAANGVEGSTAAERLQNVQQIKIELTAGQWTEVAYSAVSSATPAVITITDPGGSGDSKNYKVLYIPTEPAWCTFPARVTESPLRVSELTVKVGGAWTGSAFVGGRTLTSEIRSIEWNFNNGLEVDFVPGAGGAYGSRIFRPARVQTLKLDREMREYILQQHIDTNDTFGVYLLAEGAVYDSPHKYQAELIFPKVGVVSAPISVDGKRLAEAGDLRIMEDATYGSAIAKVKNLQSTYAA